MEGRLDYRRGVGEGRMMNDEWQGIHFDLPADDLSIELTRSLQSNLVLTPLYTLTHAQDKMSLEWMCQPELCTQHLDTVKERQSGKSFTPFF